MKLKCLTEDLYLFGDPYQNIYNYVYNDLRQDYEGEPIHIFKHNNSVTVDHPDGESGICRLLAAEDAIQVWDLRPDSNGETYWYSIEELPDALSKMQEIINEFLASHHGYA